ncbi:hypothetical protein EDD86DRAFT_273915, partial [Gorgonomyces haynaldii]
MQVPQAKKPINRTPMGEYISPDHHPLSHLAMPLPGPPDYDPKLPPSGFQYSILGKHPPTKETNIGPGPTKYDTRSINLIFDDSPHWSLGRKYSPLKSKNVTPSPFHYNDTVNSFGKNNLSYTMSGRFDFQEEETPGPDRYLPRQEFGPTSGQPKYSFGHKPKTKEESSPGPLDYQVPPTRPDFPKGPSFTMGHRIQEIQHDKYPGPDRYYPQIISSEKTASLKGIHKENKQSKTPGPANYIMPQDLFSGPRYTLTARNIPYEDDQFIGPNPGPADYNPHPQLTLPSTPSYSLGSRPKERIKTQEVPGPQAYLPKDGQIKDNHHPKVTLKGRYKSKVELTPGPADYSTLDVFSQLHPAQLVKSQKRHVGDRLKSKVEQTPGPAEYTITEKSLTKPKGPAYSLRKRLESKTGDVTPAPTAYKAQQPKMGAAVTMKSRASPFVL